MDTYGGLGARPSPKTGGWPHGPGTRDPGPWAKATGPAASFGPGPGSWAPICIHIMCSDERMCIHRYPYIRHRALARQGVFESMSEQSDVLFSCIIRAHSLQNIFPCSTRTHLSHFVFFSEFTCYNDWYQHSQIWNLKTA